MTQRELDRRIYDPLLLLEAEITGFCPVQGLGRIAGKEFYFRARGEEWTFALAIDEFCDPSDINSSSEGFFLTDRYGETLCAAGWMPLEEAERIIRDCARQYLKSIAT